MNATIHAAAIAAGMAYAAKMFTNRRGHGGNPKLAERHLTEPQLAAALAAAFDAGMKYAAQQAAAERPPCLVCGEYGGHTPGCMVVTP
jgi:hypothetical protein